MGRKQFETIVASAAREKIIRTTIVNKSNILYSGGFENVEIIPPPNTVCEIVGLKVDIPAITIATEGTQIVNVLLHTQQFHDPSILTANSPWNIRMQYDFNRWLTQPTQPAPIAVPSEIELHDIRGQKFDKDNTLIIQYINNTNWQTEAMERVYSIYYLQREIVG